MACFFPSVLLPMLLRYVCCALFKKYCRKLILLSSIDRSEPAGLFINIMDLGLRSTIVVWEVKHRIPKQIPRLNREDYNSCVKRRTPRNIILFIYNNSGGPPLYTAQIPVNQNNEEDSKPLRLNIASFMVTDWLKPTDVLSYSGILYWKKSIHHSWCFHWFSPFLFFVASPFSSVFALSFFPLLSFDYDWLKKKDP